jgi:PKHD-type hydroxylase
MKLDQLYYFFNDMHTNKFCDDVVKTCLKRDDSQATVFGADDGKELLKSRNSNVVWIGEAWVMKQINKAVYKANERANWNFNIDYLQTPQFTKYEKEQYYHWHMDVGAIDIELNPFTNGKIRKLSSVTLLNDPSEYEGGDFELGIQLADKVDIIKIKQLNKKGSCVVFPSHLWHRVTPVKKGIRYSLVSWHLGKPFI